MEIDSADPASVLTEQCLVCIANAYPVCEKTGAQGACSACVQGKVKCSLKDRVNDYWRSIGKIGRRSRSRSRSRAPSERPTPSKHLQGFHWFLQAHVKPGSEPRSQRKSVARSTGDETEDGTPARPTKKARITPTSRINDLELVIADLEERLFTAESKLATFTEANAGQPADPAIVSMAEEALARQKELDQELSAERREREATRVELRAMSDMVSQLWEGIRPSLAAATVSAVPMPSPPVVTPAILNVANVLDVCPTTSLSPSDILAQQQLDMASSEDAEYHEIPPEARDVIATLLRSAVAEIGGKVDEYQLEAVIKPDGENAEAKHSIESNPSLQDVTRTGDGEARDPCMLEGPVIDTGDLVGDPLANLESINIPSALVPYAESEPDESPAGMQGFETFPAPQSAEMASQEDPVDVTIVTDIFNMPLADSASTSQSPHHSDEDAIKADESAPDRRIDPDLSQEDDSELRISPDPSTTATSGYLEDAKPVAGNPIQSLTPGCPEVLTPVIAVSICSIPHRQCHEILILQEMSLQDAQERLPAPSLCLSSPKLVIKEQNRPSSCDALSDPLPMTESSKKPEVQLSGDSVGVDAGIDEPKRPLDGRLRQRTPGVDYLRLGNPQARGSRSKPTSKSDTPASILAESSGGVRIPQDPPQS
jgi:hypothetical protein